MDIGAIGIALWGVVAASLTAALTFATAWLIIKGALITDQALPQMARLWWREASILMKRGCIGAFSAAAYKAMRLHASLSDKFFASSIENAFANKNRIDAATATPVN